MRSVGLALRTDAEMESLEGCDLITFRRLDKLAGGPGGFLWEAGVMDQLEKETLKRALRATRSL